jgi:D-alanyl-D-alanine carboxypeptidase
MSHRLAGSLQAAAGACIRPGQVHCEGVPGPGGGQHLPGRHRALGGTGGANMAVTRRIFLAGSAATVAAGVLTTGARAQAITAAESAGDAHVASVGAADAALDRALTQFVRFPDGPPGAVALVQRGSQQLLHRAGTGNLAITAPFQGGDSMRMASIANAFSGAAALSVAAGGKLSLNETIGDWLSCLPRAWSKVTLKQLLQHTSGIPDFSGTEAFKEALLKSPLKAPPPAVCCPMLVLP